MSASPDRSEPIYRLRKVTKVYDGQRVLDVPRLDVYRGEILCLLGPNGAGKSTLLRLAAFLEPPTDGRLWFQGHPFDHGRPFDRATPMPLEVRRQVAMVFQRPVLLNRSVEANVRYGLGLRGERDGHYKVASALEQVGLVDLATQRARTLSGGEAQRVALARALVLDPQVLLLDEPTTNLDPYNVRVIEETIQTLNRERGTTIVMVSHNTFQVQRLAHRAGLLLAGKLVEVNEVEPFFDAPADARTAAFVRGDMIY